MQTSGTLAFVLPSRNLNDAEKHVAYRQARSAIDATLAGESDRMTKMVTINCLLKSFLPYYYWTGFYILKAGRLTVGPYQGTLGCLHIDVGRGVCGRAAQTQTTQIVADVHQLAQGCEHIACDPNSSSEIVVPVSDRDGKLIAVFDVDSTLTRSFDVIDQHYLEDLLHSYFSV